VVFELSSIVVQIESESDVQRHYNEMFIMVAHDSDVVRAPRVYTFLNRRGIMKKTHRCLAVMSVVSSTLWTDKNDSNFRHWPLCVTGHGGWNDNKARRLQQFP
jgi:hypothetical protein